MIAALCAMADGLYEEALLLWRELKEEGVDDEMIGVNTAVCLLYLGRMQEVRPPSPGFYDVLLTTSIGQVPLGEPSRLGLLVPYAPLQPHNHVRAVHGEVANPEGATCGAGGGDGGDPDGVGEGQRGLQAVRKVEGPVRLYGTVLDNFSIANQHQSCMGLLPYLGNSILPAMRTMIAELYRTPSSSMYPA